MKSISVLPAILGLALLCSPCTLTAQDQDNATGRVGEPAALDNATAGPASAFSEEGLCVWYGQEFNGKATASGEIFDMTALTAAHKYLPFNTIIRVTNPANGRSVEVRINDRGPFTPGQIIEVSYAAAQQLDIVASAPAAVTLAIVGEVPPAAAPDDIAGAFYIQIAAFSDQDKARQFYETLLSQGFAHARINQVSAEGGWIYRAQIGAFQSLSQAQEALASVKATYPDAFIASDAVR